MKVTFISNFLSHHQIPFSNEMYKLIGDNYTFVSTIMMEEERINMGWKIEKDFLYELKAYESEKNLEKAYKLSKESDIVIIGSAPDLFIKERLKKNKLTFKYSERLYKNGLNYKNFIRSMISAWIHHGKFQKYPLYMLCASAYTANDVSIFRNYKNKTYKWGYFPEFKLYRKEELLRYKENNIINILWAGRMIDWKEPLDVIYIANRLNKDGYSFNLNLIGTGYLEKNLREKVIEYELEDKVNFLGSMKPKEVRKYMEKSNIYLFTSNFKEGWGAVLNEAMNSGCAIVASHAIGSVPFLLEHNVNGLIYKYGDIIL